MAAVSSRARFSPQRDDRSTCDLGNQRSRYLTSVTSLKIGRYMATTSPPTTTPRKTIIIGSGSEVNVLTAGSASASEKAAILLGSAPRAPACAPTEIIWVT